jgi:hypothetical protein
MTRLLDMKDTHWLRILSHWALLSGLVMMGVLTTFTLGTAMGQNSGLPPEYDEFVWATRLPALHRVAAALDLATWLGLGGFFVLIAARFVGRAPLRSAFIAACGAGQLAGAIGACTRLMGVSALSAQYASATPDQQLSVLRSFLELQVNISAHFAAGSLLWSSGLLLVVSAAWLAHTFPRWLIGLIALTGGCNLIGDILGIVGVPVPFALFILPLVLLATSQFGVALACWRSARVSPVSVGTISHAHQEPAS